jgi:hypothetical protein
MSLPDRSARHPAGASASLNSVHLWRRATSFRRQAALARDRVAADELNDLAEIYAAEAMLARLEELIPGLRRP